MQHLPLLTGFAPIEGMVDADVVGLVHGRTAPTGYGFKMEAQIVEGNHVPEVGFWHGFCYARGIP